MFTGNYNLAIANQLNSPFNALGENLCFRRISYSEYSIETYLTLEIFLTLLTRSDYEVS